MTDEDRNPEPADQTGTDDKQPLRASFLQSVLQKPYQPLRATFSLLLKNSNIMF